MLRGSAKPNWLASGTPPRLARSPVPDDEARMFLAGAAALWLGTSLGFRLWWLGLLCLTAAVLLVISGRWGIALLVGLVAIGGFGGYFLAARYHEATQVELPSERVTLLVEAASDAVGPPGDGIVTVTVVGVREENKTRWWKGPYGRLRGEVSEWVRGSRWWVDTQMTASSSLERLPGGRPPTVWEGKPSSVRPAHHLASGIPGLAQQARAILIDRIEPSSGGGRALLGGFILGDTTGLSEWEKESMRRSGLSHYVAVSGSNVAVFLGGLFLLAGPLGWSSVRRCVIGLAGLAFFVLLIGPDASVLRASVMAGIVLVGRAVGLRPDMWKVIGAGVGGLLIVAPELAFSLGFQLSVAATIGVMVGCRWFPNLRPRSLGTALGAACGAQLAVAPILLMAVGQIPLWSPLANVIAAPVVVIATALGAIGAIFGLVPLIALGGAFAQVVLAIADLASGLPQLGWKEASVLAGAGLLALLPRWRPVALLITSLLVCAMTLALSPQIPFFKAGGPALVALDVGQGDAILLLGGKGERVLVDGGADGLRLREGLARHGVNSLDLLVISHAHHDHYGGLAEVVGTMPIGEVWYAPFPGQAEAFSDLVSGAGQVTRVSVPNLGVHEVGSVRLEVLGPRRRYLSLNDQSIVIRATLGLRSVLLTGDIEKIAQAEMDPPRADVLKVPHQGAATSYTEWLANTGAGVAVVSVGPNPFGHPDEGLLAALREAGMTVRRTDLEGDVVVDLAR